MSEFLAMGGYGLYVWTAYGMCAAAIVAEMALLRARRRRARVQAGGDEAVASRNGIAR
ncbi:MAG: heme exporter protein CcmD [Betaproteobacteria bacterium]